MPKGKTSKRAVAPKHDPVPATTRKFKGKAAQKKIQPIDQAVSDDQQTQNLQQSLTEMMQQQFSNLAESMTQHMMEEVNLDVAKATVSSDSTAEASTSTEAVQPEPQNSLQAVLDSILTTDKRGEHQLNVLSKTVQFDMPLGSDLPSKTVEKIKLGDYVDLNQVLFPHRESQQLVIDTVQGTPTMNIRQSQMRTINSIE